MYKKVFKLRNIENSFISMKFNAKLVLPGLVKDATGGCTSETKVPQKPHRCL